MSGAVNGRFGASQSPGASLVRDERDIPERPTSNTPKHRVPAFVLRRKRGLNAPPLPWAARAGRVANVTPRLRCLATLFARAARGAAADGAIFRPWPPTRATTGRAREPAALASGAPERQARRRRRAAQPKTVPPPSRAGDAIAREAEAEARSAATAAKRARRRRSCHAEARSRRARSRRRRGTAEAAPRRRRRPAPGSHGVRTRSRRRPHRGQGRRGRPEDGRRLLRRLPGR